MLLRPLDHNVRCLSARFAGSSASFHWLRIPVGVRRPAFAGRTLSFYPLVETGWANSTCVKGVPQMSATTRPNVSFPWRPTAKRAADPWTGRLAISLNVLARRNAGSIGLHTHALASETSVASTCLIPLVINRSHKLFKLITSRP